MTRNFPVFLNISNKKIYVYGAGRVASRRVATLLAFAPLLTVIAPDASPLILEEAKKQSLIYEKKVYERGSIPSDVWMVLAATDDKDVNMQIGFECREKGILVNVCSDKELCDFQFPGVAMKGDLVVGINAGGQDHRLARQWTERIRKEVETDGDVSQTKKTSHHSES